MLEIMLYTLIMFYGLCGILLGKVWYLMFGETVGWECPLCVIFFRWLFWPLLLPAVLVRGK